MGPDSPLVPLDVLGAICALRPVITLLTNVRQIAWSSVCVSDECLPYLLSIIGQDLSVFDMAWEDSEDPSGAIPAALEQLAAQPCLREFTLLNRQLPTNRAASLSFSIKFLRQSHLLTKMVCDAIAIPAEAIPVTWRLSLMFLSLMYAFQIPFHPLHMSQAIHSQASRPSRQSQQRPHIAPSPRRLPSATSINSFYISSLLLRGRHRVSVPWHPPAARRGYHVVVDGQIRRRRGQHQCQSGSGLARSHPRTV